MVFAGLMTVVLWLATSATVLAQSLADDISQLVMDYEKLAQEKKILSDMYEGYRIVSAGYSQIRSIAQGNFTLHQNFLNALLAVSPAVRNDYRVVNIIDNELELVKEYQAVQVYFGSGGHFTAAELSYFTTMYANLLNGSLRNLDELAMVMTPGELRMSDAERLSTIDRIDQDMTDKLSFLRVFNNEGAIQAGQRSVEQNDIGAMQGLWGINQ
jgi:hypothetical protein